MHAKITIKISRLLMSLENFPFSDNFVHFRTEVIVRVEQETRDDKHGG